MLTSFFAFHLNTTALRYCQILNVNFFKNFLAYVKIST